MPKIKSKILVVDDNAGIRSALGILLPIRITADLNMDNQAVIRVANNGKAISLQQIEEIFVPFYTTNGYRTKSFQADYGEAQR